MPYKIIVVEHDARKSRLLAAKNKILNKLVKTKAAHTLNELEDLLIDILDLLDVK